MSNLREAAQAALEAPQPVAEVTQVDLFADHQGPVEAYEFLPVGTKLYAAPPQRRPLTDEHAKQLSRVGPVYSLDGIVTRTPLAYKNELQDAVMRGIRIAENAHGIERNLNEQPKS